MVNGRCEQCAGRNLTGREDPDCDCWCHNPDGDPEGEDEGYDQD